MKAKAQLIQLLDVQALLVLCAWILGVVTWAPTGCSSAISTPPASGDSGEGGAILADHAQKAASRLLGGSNGSTMICARGMTPTCTPESRTGVQTWFLPRSSACAQSARLSARLS
eukprot:CAMPEP_0115397722 /NCGR_PEP_ID=MMETSP0271-20121206/13952_1 /TAXON_ID=71861 /ORGANISM="Scrippsiella trochoidea, Strain CCMP3099" /LENGTH=114 /DNA_ID=CAMNT_0002821481 /DNA_START=523 /DNA_END=864 /DNA_ORIENTATION=-